MFKDLETTQKGDAGEILVDKFLVEKGVMIYAPILDGSHPVDRILYNSKKKQFFFADTKTKSCRELYPDSCIDVKDYKHYKEISEKFNIPVILFFVDFKNKKCYGGNLEKISKPYKGYPKYGMAKEELIYFPLELMDTFFDL